MIKVIPLAATVAVASMLAACTPQNPQESSDAQETTGSESFTTQPAAENAGVVAEVSTSTSYDSPASTEQVRFVLFVDQAGVITDAQTEVLAKAPISIMRQEAFQKDLPAAVVGKKLSELQNIDRVGGSSLTTGAFNAALADLQAQL